MQRSKETRHSGGPLFSLLLLPLLALALVGCPAQDAGNSGDATEAASAAGDSTSGDSTAADPAALAARADELAQELLIADTHIDVPYRLQEVDADVSQRTEDGDFDAVRAREGGLDAAFMSIYVPADYQETGGAKEFADSLIDGVEAIVAASPDIFTLATSPDEVLAAKEAGKIALPLGMENGEPIEGDLANLRHFHDRGIRYITLTHSKNNHISDSSYEALDAREWQGLSPFGRELVAEMNRLGTIVDISHVSDDAFWQVLEVTVAPVIATHSSARHFTPGFERNMADDMIEALAENGGLIMINFGSAFLTEAANAYSQDRWQAVDDHVRERGLDPGSDEARTAGREYAESYAEENPYPYATVEDVADHIDHVVELVGVDHVGLGSDFDGVGDTLPEGLKDASEYPNLIAELLERGYSEADIEKILGGNLIRVWREIERVAEELQAAGETKAAA